MPQFYENQILELLECYVPAESVLASPKPVLTRPDQAEQSIQDGHRDVVGSRGYRDRSATVDSAPLWISG